MDMSLVFKAEIRAQFLFIGRFRELKRILTTNYHLSLCQVLLKTREGQLNRLSLGPTFLFRDLRSRLGIFNMSNETAKNSTMQRLIVCLNNVYGPTVAILMTKAIKICLCNNG